MQIERAYRSYEEFEREELRRTERIDMSFDEILSDFDNDERARKSRIKEGLFDSYEEFDNDSYED